MTEETRGDVLANYVRALSDLPKWAVTSAFAEWERQHTKRPSPANIRLPAARCSVLHRCLQKHGIFRLPDVEAARQICHGL